MNSYSFNHWMQAFWKTQLTGDIQWRRFFLVDLTHYQEFISKALSCYRLKLSHWQTKYYIFQMKIGLLNSSTWFSHNILHAVFKANFLFVETQKRFQKHKHYKFRRITFNHVVSAFGSFWFDSTVFAYLNIPDSGPENVTHDSESVLYRNE